MTNLKLFHLLLIEIKEDLENLNALEELLSHSLLICLSQFVTTVRRWLTVDISTVIHLSHCGGFAGA